MQTDFGWALDQLKHGRMLARKGWNGKGMWIALSPGFELEADRVFTPPIADAIGDGTGQFLPYLMMRTVSGTFVPWVASQTDVLANDWELVG